MSKRAAEWQGGEERYGGPSQPEQMGDVPKQATAAQMAKRKIMQAKGSRRPRSESPLPNTGNVFDQATQSGLIGSTTMTNPTNPFAQSSFNFGGTNGNASSQSFASGGGSFAFGGASGQQTQQSTPNTNSSFQFGAPTTSFQFGQAQPQTNGFSTHFGQQNGEAKGLFESATPKPSTGLFGQETPKTNTSVFGQETPKPNNPFGAAQQAKPSNIFSAAQNGTTGFTFGQKPAEVPQASSSTFAGFGSQASQPERPVSDGWSSFLSQKSTETPKPTTNGFTPSTTSIFNTQSNGASTNGSSVFSGFGQTPKAASAFKITAQPDDDDAMMSPENTPQKQDSGLFSNLNASKDAATSEPAKALFQPGQGPSLFDRIQKTASAPTSQSTASQNLFGGAAIPKTPAANLFTPQPASLTPAPSKPISQPNSTPSVPTTQASQTSMDSTKDEDFKDIRELNEGLLQHLSTQDINKDFSTILKYYMQEVAQIQSKTNTAPQSTTSNKDSSAPPAQPIYPALSGASDTAKLFQATLDKPAQPPSTPFTNSLFMTKSNGSSNSKPDAQPAIGGFKPTTAPPVGGFIPSIVPPAGGFLSSFGQQAAANAEKEKKRRRDENFDSDEENEEEWEKKDAAEQAAKKAKIEEAAKTATGFKFTPVASADKPSNGLTTAPDASAAKPSHGFTFTSATSTPATNSLFNFKPVEQDKTKTVEDHTWSQGTPIKFAGATTSSTPAAAPKFGLFGANTAPAGNGSVFSNHNKPAETPSAAADEEDAAPPEPQLEDMAVLLPSEKEESDVLHFVAKSKSRKLEDHDGKLVWIDKGRGPIWILKNKTTGKTRVLQKVEDSGRVTMNFSLLPGAGTLYKHEGMNGKAVMATFFDHIGEKDPKKPRSWAIIVGQQDDAASIARILKEEHNK